MAILRRESKRTGKVSWQVMVDTRDPVTGKRKRHTIDTFRLKGAAQAAERKAIDAIQRGEFQTVQPPPPKVWTVAELVTQWLTERKATVSANTHSQYASAFAKHVKPALGDMDVTTVTRVDIKAMVRAWHSNGLGAQLQHRSLLVLRCALDEAVEDGALAANPATGITLPSPKPRRDLPQWTREQVRAFLAEGERDQLGVFWNLTAIEGMRRAEALALRWRDLHWNDDESECRAVIVQTVIPDASRGGAALIQSKAKTRGSQRTVILAGSTVAALRRHRDRQAFQRRELANLWPDGLNLIVTDAMGSVVRPDAVRRHRLAVIAAAGVPDPGTHGLRHHAATAMLRAGVSPAIVAQKIGHSDIGLTVNTYGHFLASDQGAANVALEELLADPATGTDDR